MKKFNLLFFVLLSISIAAQQKNELTLTTNVSEAIVFIDGAQVTRKKTIDLLPGKTSVKFTNLSPYIDEKSIQAKVNGKVMVLTVNHQLNYTDSIKQSNELKVLIGKLDATNDKYNLENTNIEIINEELSFLRDNRIVGGTAQGVNIINLKEASNYYHERISFLKLKEIEKKKNLEILTNEKNALEKELSKLGNAKPTPVGEIYLEVESKTNLKCDVDLSYYVKNAGWFPTYDIRVNNIEEPVQLIYKANIHQNTKEDWKNISLKVSSANPNTGNTAPQLKTYLIDYYTKPPLYNGSTSFKQISGKVIDYSTKEPLVGASIMIKGSTIGTITNINGNFELSLPKNAETLTVNYIGYTPQELPITNSHLVVNLTEDTRTLDEVVVVGYGAQSKLGNALKGIMPGIQTRGNSNINSKAEYTPLPINQIENQTTVEFEIKTPFSISSNNKNLSVEVENYSLIAKYDYYCAPKVDKDAFLMANIVDWEKYNLLEGEANIFFENTFVGKTILDVRYTSDTLSLSLGRDKNVIVSREKIKDIIKKQFLGTKKEDTRAWKIIVKNNKKQTVNFVLLDQIPVSTMTEIEVIPQNLSNGILNAENGEVKWKFELKPSNKSEFELKYTVKYPKEKTLLVE